MSDTASPAPDGAATPPAYLNETTAVERLLQLEDAGNVSEEEASAEASPEPANEPEEEEAEIAPEGDEAAETENEEPGDDAPEPQPNDTRTEDDESGTRLHRLRDGRQVSLGDLKKAYDRAGEYERVMPQIQAERARFEQDRQALAAQQQQFQPVLAQVATMLQQQIVPAPDPALLQTDPVEFHNQRWLHENSVNELRKVTAAQSEAQQRAAAQAQQSQRAYLYDQQQKLVEAMPDLRDPEKAKAFNADFQEVGRHAGFSDQELGQVYDHRLFKLAELAAYGLKAKQAEARGKQVKTEKAAAVAAKVVDKPPVAAPAARVGVGVRKAEAARGAVERLRKNPSNTEAQIAALMALEE